MVRKRKHRHKHKQNSAVDLPKFPTTSYVDFKIYFHDLLIQMLLADKTQDEKEDTINRIRRLMNHLKEFVDGCACEEENLL